MREEGRIGGEVGLGLAWLGLTGDKGGRGRAGMWASSLRDWQRYLDLVRHAHIYAHCAPRGVVGGPSIIDPNIIECQEWER